jgi:hypothetical protein
LANVTPVKHNDEWANVNLQDRLRVATRAFLVDLGAAGVRLDVERSPELRDALNRYLERVLDAAGHAAIEGLLQAQAPRLGRTLVRPRRVLRCRTTVECVSLFAWRMGFGEGTNRRQDTMKRTSTGKPSPGYRNYRPTITGKQAPRRMFGLGDVCYPMDENKCVCGFPLAKHPMEVIDASKARIAGALRGLPRTQQRLTVERQRRQSAPNVEVARGGQWVQPGSVPA